MTLHAGQWEYTGLSGGRTTVDADFRIAAPPMARNPYAPQDEAPYSASSPRKDPINVKPDPNTQLPLGDAVLPLMLFVAGYAAYKYKRRRKEC